MSSDLTALAMGEGRVTLEPLVSQRPPSTGAGGGAGSRGEGGARGGGRGEGGHGNSGVR